jgi:phosphotransferase system  glucose/maltose/N-acetylglucosamine-specific IIC component
MVKEEGLALTSSVSAFLGVTEPAMFGDMNAGTPPTPTLPNTLLAPIMAPKTLDVQIAAKKRKMVKEEGLALTSSVSAFLGVTEPAMFGVNLPLKVPFKQQNLGKY